MFHLKGYNEFGMKMTKPSKRINHTISFARSKKLKSFVVFNDDLGLMIEKTSPSKRYSFKWTTNSSKSSAWTSRPRLIQVTRKI